MSLGSSTIWGAFAAISGLLLFGVGIYFMRFTAVCAPDESHVECIRSWFGAVGPCIAMIALLVGLWQFFVNRDSSERQARAYVGISGGGMQILNLPPGQGQAIGVEIKLLNSGKTPAYNFRTWYPNIVVAPENTPPFSEPPSPLLSQQSSILFSGNDMTLLSIVAVSPQDLIDIRAGTKAIYAWGAASYDDAFGKARSLRFYDRNGSERGFNIGSWPLQPHPPGYQAN